MKDRKIKIISLAAVIVAVLGLTIAFAAMSKVLNISSTGSMDTAIWDIHFKNVQFQSKSANASISGTPTPTNNDKGTTIEGLNVTLKQPGDYVTYTADIENEGDIDAEIQLVTPPSLTQRQEELFEFKVVYTGTNDELKQGDFLSSKSPNNVKHITITFKYKDITDKDKLPSTPEEISLSYSIKYVQSDKEETTTQQSGGSASEYGEEIASTTFGDGFTATYYGGTQVAKADTNSTGVKAMSYDNTLTDDVRYEGGTLVISGSGAIPDSADGGNVDLLLFLLNATTMEEVMANQDKYFDGNGYPLLKYKPTNLVLEEGITRVGNNTFEYSFYFITSINLPYGLLSIGNDAFVRTNLTSVIIPSSVISIGDNAFYNCTSLAEVYIGKNTNEIGSSAFSWLSNNSIIFVETQEVANLFNSNNYNSSTTQVIVDPTKFN